MTAMNEDRAAFEDWLGIKPFNAAHDLAWEAFKAGAAWQRAQGAVPEGWRLVPIEPTEEMVAAAVQEADRQESYWRYRGKDFWCALLAAAPATPAAQWAVPDALREAVEYLDDNPFNEIGAGSILHLAMRDALAAAALAANQRQAAGVPEGWREDVYLAAQMLTWGDADGGLTERQITEIEQHAKKLLDMLAAAPAHPAERQDQGEVQRLREAQWTTQKPTEPGAYWIRGFRLFEPESAPALVEVADDGGELVCNLHESNSQDSLRMWSPVADFNEEFEWLGPLQALAASTGQEQGEVQRLREALEAIATCTGDDQARDCAMAALAASTGQEVGKP